MGQRLPLVVGPDGLDQQLQPADTIPLPAYGPSGVVSGCKMWIGETKTDASGAWSVDLTKAGFTVAPSIFPSALSVDTAVANSADAVWTARTATSASGYVNLPATIAIGGLADKRAGVNVVVAVLAIGP